MDPFEEELTQLPPRVQSFCREYIVDMHGKQAAIRAGYSPKTAVVQASRLLSKANVKKAIEIGVAERARRTSIDADWLLVRLAAEAEADLADIFHNDGLLKPISEWPEIWRKGLVNGVDITIDAEGEPTFKVRLSDRIKRLELIGRHIDVQAFKDKVEMLADKDVVAMLKEARQKAGIS